MFKLRIIAKSKRPATHEERTVKVAATLSLTLVYYYGLLLFVWLHFVRMEVYLDMTGGHALRSQIKFYDCRHHRSGRCSP